jgi:hypothetical protein
MLDLMPTALRAFAAAAIESFGTFQPNHVCSFLHVFIAVLNNFRTPKVLC